MPDQAVYEVLLTRESSESTTLRIRANSDDEAQAIAVAIAGAHGENLPISAWEPDDGNSNDIFVSDVSEEDEDASSSPIYTLADVPAGASVDLDEEEDL